MRHVRRVPFSLSLSFTLVKKKKTNHRPTHMAPEVWSDLENHKSHLTKKIDVYSFSVIMWEMLTLKKPWANVNFSYKIGRRLLKGERLTFDSDEGAYEDADQLDPPENYIKIMKMCWAKVSERPDFQTVRDEMASWGPYIQFTRKMSRKKKKKKQDGGG